jgi:hypothetical protein
MCTILFGSFYFLIYYYNVVCSYYTSFYNVRTVSTSLVCDVVCGGISIRSSRPALYLALSILWFYAIRMSRRSTGAGGSSGTGVSVCPSPRSLRILDICGSFLALVAVPRINTNFYSSSCASYCSLASLVCISTLLEGGLLCLALIIFSMRSSYCIYLLSHRISIAVMVSALTSRYGVFFGCDAVS